MVRGGGEFPLPLSWTARILITRAPYSAFELLHYKDIDVERLLPHVPGLEALQPRILERVGIAGKCVADVPVHREAAC